MKQVKVSMYNSDEESSFKYEINQLAEVTYYLKRTSLHILVSLVLSLISLPVYTVIYRVYHKSLFVFYEYASIIVLLSIFTFAILGIFLLFKFNSYRTKGMIIYEELTDEIDWSNKRESFIKRPPLQARITIKDFLKTSDLPFTSGANGQAFYLVLFFINIIASVIIQIFM